MLAERPGNKLAFSLRNVVVNPRIGLLFVVPGVDVTLRVNGSARLVTTPALLDSLGIGGKRPRLAILVHVERLYLHCARAFNRASLWRPQGWRDTTSLPSAGTILRDQTGSTASAAEIDAELEAVNRYLYRGHARSGGQRTVPVPIRVVLWPERDAVMRTSLESRATAADSSSCDEAAPRSPHSADRWRWLCQGKCRSRTWRTVLRRRRSRRWSNH